MTALGGFLRAAWARFARVHTASFEPALALEERAILGLATSHVQVEKVEDGWAVETLTLFQETERRSARVVVTESPFADLLGLTVAVVRKDVRELEKRAEPLIPALWAGYRRVLGNGNWSAIIPSTGQRRLRIYRSSGGLYLQVGYSFPVQIRGGTNVTLPLQLAAAFAIAGQNK